MNEIIKTIKEITRVEDGNRIISFGHDNGTYYLSTKLKTEEAADIIFKTNNKLRAVVEWRILVNSHLNELEKEAWNEQGH